MTCMTNLMTNRQVHRGDAKCKGVSSCKDSERHTNLRTHTFLLGTQSTNN